MLHILIWKWVYLFSVKQTRHTKKTEHLIIKSNVLFFFVWRRKIHVTECSSRAFLGTISGDWIGVVGVKVEVIKPLIYGRIRTRTEQGAGREADTNTRTLEVQGLTSQPPIFLKLYIWIYYFCPPSDISHNLRSWLQIVWFCNGKFLVFALGADSLLNGPI